MFDIGWSELLVIGVVALVVIGPKDLPKVLKSVGFWVRKARTISREFQSSVEQMVREAELEDVKKEIQKVTSVDLKSEFEKTIDPKGELQAALEPPVLPSFDAPLPESAKPAAPPPDEAAPPALPGAPPDEALLEPPPPAADGPPAAAPEKVMEPQGAGAPPPKSGTAS